MYILFIFIYIYIYIIIIRLHPPPSSISTIIIIIQSMADYICRYLGRLARAIFTRADIQSTIVLVAMGPKPAKQRKLEESASGEGAPASGGDDVVASTVLGLPSTTAPPTPAEARTVLGLPSTTAPPTPAFPSAKEQQAADPEAIAQYMEQLVPSVVHRLSMKLYEDPRLNLRVPLKHQVAPPIASTKSLVSNFREPFNSDNCIASLHSTGLYEAALPIWRVNPLATTWRDYSLVVGANTWSQLEACEGFWSSETHRSNGNRYIYPGFIPSACGPANEVEAGLKKNIPLLDLPACGGRIILWSLYCAFDRALENDDIDEVLRLYEASLTATIRIRAAPRKEQLVLDGLTLEDTLRTSACAMGADSVVAFVSKLLLLDGVSDESLSGPGMVVLLTKHGVLWKGRNTTRDMAYAVLGLVPYAKHDVCRKALGKLDAVAPSLLSDPTKIMRLCQLIKKGTTSVEDRLKVFSYVIESMLLAVLSKDSTVEEFSVPILCGGKNQAPNEDPFMRVLYVYTEMVW